MTYGLLCRLPVLKGKKLSLPAWVPETSVRADSHRSLRGGRTAADGSETNPPPFPRLPLHPVQDAWDRAGAASVAAPPPDPDSPRGCSGFLFDASCLKVFLLLCIKEEKKVQKVFYMKCLLNSTAEGVNLQTWCGGIILNICNRNKCVTFFMKRISLDANFFSACFFFLAVCEVSSLISIFFPKM